MHLTFFITPAISLTSRAQTRSSTSMNIFKRQFGELWRLSTLLSQIRHFKSRSDRQLSLNLCILRRWPMSRRPSSFASCCTTAQQLTLSLRPVLTPALFRLITRSCQALRMPASALSGDEKPQIFPTTLCRSNFGTVGSNVSTQALSSSFPRLTHCLFDPKSFLVINDKSSNECLEALLALTQSNKQSAARSSMLLPPLRLLNFRSLKTIFGLLCIPSLCSRLRREIKDQSTSWPILHHVLVLSASYASSSPFHQWTSCAQH